MKGKTIFILVIVIIVFFRLCCGIFVIQPIGALPQGATIVYWRIGLNLPFISSADGLLDESGNGVSLLGRAMFLAKLAEPIKERKIMQFDYSEQFYLWSTNGKTFQK